MPTIKNDIPNGIYFKGERKMKMKCLVTGATGYLGTVLVEALYNKGYSVASLALPHI